MEYCSEEPRVEIYINTDEEGFSLPTGIIWIAALILNMKQSILRTNRKSWIGSRVSFQILR